MSTRRESQQQEMWVQTQDLPQAPGHRFYTQLNTLLRVLGVDCGYVSNLEAGKRNPTLATIKRIADALGVSVDKLFK